MISIEKWMILTPLQKLPKNVRDVGKLIVATDFEWLPKVQKIAQSGHTGHHLNRSSADAEYDKKDVVDELDKGWPNSVSLIQMMTLFSWKWRKPTKELW